MPRVVSPPLRDRSEQTDVSGRYRCYVVLLRLDDSQVLLSRDRDGTGLPTVEIPCDQRVAPNLLPAIERNFGIAATARFSVPVQDLDPRGRCAVLDVSEERSLPGEVLWANVGSFPWRALRSDGARTILRRALARVTEYASGQMPARFVRPGWLTEVRNWTRESLARRGRKLHGTWSQYNMGPDSSLIRFAAEEGDVWFKAVPSASVREFRITRRLAEIDLPCLAPLLAVREDWNAWLASDCTGKELDGNAALGAWKAAARGLSRLQRASIPHAGSLLAAGCHDLRASALREAIEPFLSRVAVLMEQQKKTPPRRLGLADLRLIEKQVRADCRELEETGIPDVLGHSDLNSGNVLIDGRRSVFLDWKEGHIGHPLLSLEYLRAMAGRSGIREDHQVAQRLEYLSCWSEAGAVREMARSLTLMPLLAPFAYALSCRDLLTGDREVRPELGALLRTLARRMHAEAGLREGTPVRRRDGAAAADARHAQIPAPEPFRSGGEEVITDDVQQTRDRCRGLGRGRDSVEPD